MARPAATPQIDHARSSQQTALYSDLTMLADVAAQGVRHPAIPWRSRCDTWCNANGLGIGPGMGCDRERSSGVDRSA